LANVTIFSESLKTLNGFFAPSLPGPAVFEAFFEQAEEFHIADKAPRGLVDKARRDLADETFYEKIRTEAFQHIHKEVDIFLKTETFKILRLFFIFLLHPCPLDDLELVELHRTDRKGVDQLSGVKHHLPGLPRKS
jgi:hypothetical protein